MVTLYYYLIRPDLVLTPDETGATIARNDFGQSTKVSVIGNPLLTGLKYTDMSETKDYLDEIRISDRKVILLAAQGKATVDAINWLHACLAKSTLENWCVIARLNPKKKSLWNRQLNQLVQGVAGEILVNDPRAQRLDYNHLAACCDVTLSPYSTALVVSAFFNRLPISIIDQVGRKSMMKAWKLSSNPLVEMGGCIENPKIDNLDSIFKRYSPTCFRSVFERDWKFKPDKAVETIYSVIS